MSAEAQDGDGTSRGSPGGLRHWGGFLASGLLAFVVDAAVLEAGVRLLALDPLLARLAAISSAMVIGWLAHRKLTFALEQRPTLAEFLRYLTAAWSAAAVNYGVFAGLLLQWPLVPRLGALVFASSAAMILSYLAMRYGVFRAR